MRQFIIGAIGWIAPDIAPRYRIRLALFCLLWLAVVVAVVGWLLLRP